MIIAQFNRQTVGKLNSDDPYLLKAKSICVDWLAGVQRFNLTTSGSTGPPKRITASANQLRASVRATSQALSLSSGLRAFVCLNIEFIGGFMMLIRAMELDWEVVLAKPSSNPLTDCPSTLNFDFTALVPMQLWDIVSDSTTARRTHQLGKILLGGAGLTSVQAERFRRLQQDVYLGYGMTETVSHVALQKLMPDEESANVYKVTGDVTYGTDNRGCLFFRGAVTDHQLIQTNDLAELIPGEKSFRLIGRIDNTVNSGGIKIQIEELEAVIENLLVSEGLALPFFLWKKPDERLGEALIMVIEGEQVRETKLQAILKRELPRLKRPRQLYFSKQFLKTASGKTDKSGTFDALASDLTI